MSSTVASSSTTTTTTTITSKEKTYNSAIPNHFAVMCVMEDLIGSPDSESEDALIASRARAVGQLSGLANTMGRDWCENEIIPYLLRIAFEDEKSVSVAATSQIADLCETKYFSKSVEMQESLILSVGVAFLTSAHLEVRSAAIVGVRRACLIFAKNESKLSSSSSTSSSVSLSAALKEQTELDASQLVLRVVQRCLFDTAYPTSIASGILLMGPESIQLSAALSAFNLRPVPLLTRDAIWIMSQLFGANSTLTQLRLETAICGGSGRVTIIDDAIVVLACDLLGFLASNNSNNNNNNNNNLTEKETEEILYFSSILLNYLLEHVFSVNCPSVILLEQSLPKLCSAVDSLRKTTALLSPSCQNDENIQQLLRKLLKMVASVFVRIVRDWSCCEDWGARFVIAKFSPQIFDSLLTIAEERGGNVNNNNNNNSNKYGNHFIIFYEVGVELLQRILPRLANDDETEVNSAAAGSLPQLVSRFEKSSLSISNSGGGGSHNGSSAFSGSILKGIFTSENEKFSQQLSVQEAVAASLGEAMKNVSENKNSNGATSSLASTAQSTLSEMLATCQDDGVRVSIVESLLWSTVVDAALKNSSSNNNSNNLLQGEFKQSLRNVLDHLTDVPHSVSTENPDVPLLTVTSWRIREKLGEATGKMLSKILIHLQNVSNLRFNSNNNNNNMKQQQIQLPTNVVDFIVNPFVRLLFDRFFQVRSTSLCQLVCEFHNNSNNSQQQQQRQKLKPEIPSLWAWILQFKPTAQRAPHYQTRLAFISTALVCANETEVIQILENGSRDKVVNVRRAVAMALNQGCHNMMNNNNNNKNNTDSLLKGNFSQNSISSSSSSAKTSNISELFDKKNDAEKDDSEEKNDTIAKSQKLSDEEKFYLIPQLCFTWSSSVAGRVLDLLERLLSDESSDVREAAIAGLSRCS